MCTVGLRSLSETDFRASWNRNIGPAILNVATRIRNEIKKPETKKLITEMVIIIGDNIS
jgi:hypothetical protein